MCRPIGDLLGPHWQGLGRGVLWQRNQAQARGAGAGAGESRAVESRAHVTGGGGKQTGAVYVGDEASRGVTAAEIRFRIYQGPAPVSPHCLLLSG